MEQSNLTPQDQIISPETSVNPTPTVGDANPVQPILVQKNSPVMMILMIAAIAALVGGAYYFGMQKGVQVSVEEEPILVEANDPRFLATPETTPDLKPTFIMTESFQDILQKNCKMVDLGKGASVEAIKESLLPVAVDSQKLNAKYTVPGSLICSGGDPNAKDDYVLVELQDKTYQTFINIYTSESQELGHGGPAYLGSFETIVKKEGNLTYSIMLSGSEGPTFTDTASVVIKAEKALKLSNGEILYVNAIEDAIPDGDPRLIEFLDKYAVDSDFEPGKREISNVDMEEVKAKFFANQTTLGQSEKNAMAALKTKLDGVTLK
jgi:hypothetical protein